MSSNPITNFIATRLQTQESRDAELRARVARSAIYAQKIVEGELYQTGTSTPEDAEPRIYDRPMYGSAHPNLKHTAAGNRGTFLAAEYYVDKNQKKRDELLAKSAEN